MVLLMYRMENKDILVTGDLFNFKEVVDPEFLSSSFALCMEMNSAALNYIFTKPNPAIPSQT